MKASMCKIIAITLTVMLVYLFVSCGADIYSPDCETGNCVVVNFKGSVLVKPEVTGISDIPVEVNFENPNTYPVRVMNIVTGKTDENGEFNLKATIDLNSFEDYWLRVYVPVQEVYISKPPRSSHISKTFNSFDEDAFQNINFEFYKKTMLTINLNRIQTDDFESFTVGPHVEDWLYNLGFTIKDPNTKDEVIQFITAADVYTQIVWVKILKNGERHTHIDSLICRTNTNNVFNINF